MRLNITHEELWKKVVNAVIQQEHLLQTLLDEMSQIIELYEADIYPDSDEEYARYLNADIDKIVEMFDGSDIGEEIKNAREVGEEIKNARELQTNRFYYAIPHTREDLHTPYIEFTHKRAENLEQFFDYINDIENLALWIIDYLK